MHIPPGIDISFYLFYQADIKVAKLSICISG